MKSYITSFVPCNDEVVRDTAMTIFEGLYVGEDKPTTFEDLVAYYGEDAKHKIYEYVHNEDFSYWYGLEDIKEQIEDDDIGEYFEESTIKDYVSNNYAVNEVYDDYDIKQYVRGYLDADDVYDGEDLVRYIDDDAMIEHITDEYGVGDIFGEDDIIDYARDNIEWEDIYDEDDVWEDFTKKWDYDDSDLIERVVEYHNPSIFDDSEIINYTIQNISVEDLLDDRDSDEVKEYITSHLKGYFTESEVFTMLCNWDKEESKEEETNE